MVVDRARSTPIWLTCVQGACSQSDYELDLSEKPSDCKHAKDYGKNDYSFPFQPSKLDLKTQENRMRSKWLLASALAGCFALGWGAHAVTAQRRTPVSVTRLYTGSDGETHAEEIADTRLTPDAARSGLEASDVIRVSGLQFARTAPGWVRDWHVAERHQYIVTLSGRGEIELAGGRKIPLVPGSVILAEDSTGKGHISRTLGTEDRIALNIQIADR